MGFMRTCSRNSALIRYASMDKMRQTDCENEEKLLSASPAYSAAGQETECRVNLMSCTQWDISPALSNAAKGVTKPKEMKRESQHFQKIPNKQELVSSPLGIVFECQLAAGKVECRLELGGAAVADPHPRAVLFPLTLSAKLDRPCALVSSTKTSDPPCDSVPLLTL